MSKIENYVHYSYKKQIYFVWNADGKMKCPSSGDWVDSVTYLNISTMQIFTRVKTDFADKFVRNYERD